MLELPSLSGHECYRLVGVGRCSFVGCPSSVLSFIVMCYGHGVVILFCSLWSRVPVVLCSCRKLNFREDSNLYCKISG